MAKILILAESGFGKSTSAGEIPELGIKGLDPKKSMIIACSEKGLPFRGWRKKYVSIAKDPQNGNYLATNDPAKINKTIDFCLKNRPEIDNYLVDDFNFVMQDYYMENAKNKGFATFQSIGYDVNTIFKRFDAIHREGKNIIVMGHPDYYEVNGVHKVKLKTVGNMVDQYITPVGKFEVVLMGVEENDERSGAIKKQFATGYVSDSVRGKAPYGMFEDLYIPNDLGYVVEKVNEYEHAE
jgi:hypothetical protein